MIKQVTPQVDFQALAKLLNDSFATVAKDFGLTKENCPTNTAFITGEELKSQFNGNSEFYYKDDNNAMAGFIAIEQSKRDVGTYYIEKVAVHPHARHKGVGKLLMDFATGRIKEIGGKRISIGLIETNAVLKKWYKGQGFAEVEVKSFAHLPFDVCMMEKSII